ncbi:MAG: glycogen/starch/alpha-glucan phosphorylase [Catonella sp.]|uniref:glycogen/starch/alpha-glucan phosphorylase n=1 Tax=Catonella sp. TaxID=2382125 RepID=UPI003FA00EB1
MSNKFKKKHGHVREVAEPAIKPVQTSVTNFDQIEAAITDKLSRHFGASFEEATKDQIYKATAITVKDILLAKRREFKEANNKSGGKRVYYLCMEFLVGRSLKNNLYNLGLTNIYAEILKKHGYDLNELYEMEPDAGLGNGGLGRLAACFMDSLASLNYPATGFSILYEYGLFRQKIVEGWQMELPDVWLPGGEVWLSPRTDKTFVVKFGGHVNETWTENGLITEQVDCEEVEAVPYDMMISGADSKGVSVLRVWRSRDIDTFDMNSFSRGDYARATMGNNKAELISKVLYPRDSHYEGKELRLKQQYFLVSASAQNIIADHMKYYPSLDNLADKVAIHINDTHPAMIVPELMRIFMDEYHYSWDNAFNIISKTLAYTNHTVLAEALEKWPEEMMRRLLPRIYQIIHELNERHCKHVYDKFAGDWGKCSHMAIISGGVIHMANLCIMGSHNVNGVSELHSDILKKSVFKDFYDDTPDKFTNVTNGIAHRRWLCQSNPRLSGLLDEIIGTSYKKNGPDLIKLLAFQNDNAILDKLAEIKLANKKDFAELLFQDSGIKINPDSVFDVHVKRLHEYKRQLLNALQIIALYLDLKENPSLDIVPQTYLFAAKAAPGYDRAKSIIRLIVNLGEEIAKDPIISKKLQVVFLENYRVTMAEHIMPASDISEQISLAGKEASGTGNMKLMINGAVTIGTLDGANVEISEAVGRDNIYIFGMTDREVEDKWRDGYNPYKYYEENHRLKRAVDYLKNGINGNDFSDIHRYLLVGDHGIADPYMCMADFGDYCRARYDMMNDYKNQRDWTKKSLVNIASAGRFAADTAIRKYAEEIWGITPIK